MNNLLVRWLFACLLFFLAWSYIVVWGAGLRYTNDSYFYEAAAQSFAAHAQLQNPDGSAFTHWAPLYPVILSVGIVHIRLWAAILNILFMGGAFYFLLKLSDSFLVTNFARWAFTLLLASAPPLLLVSHFLWSESVFMGFFAAFCYFYAREKLSLLVIFLGIMLMLVRNVGLVLVFFWIIGSGLPRLNRSFLWRIVLLFFPSALWNVYVVVQSNWWRDLWDIAAPERAYYERLWSVFQHYSYNFLPAVLPYSEYLFLIVLVLFFAFVQNFRFRSLYVVVVGYILFLGIFHLQVAELARLLAVVYPFFVLLIVFVIEWFMRRWLDIKYVFMMFLVVFILFSGFRFYKNALDFRTYNEVVSVGLSWDSQSKVSQSR
ncbi:MAG: hypothetical protein JJT94_01325 [Bernardetiaceae bacterium]|nr:hypothetical protein [Bernardetiaceae bacterium]